MFNLYFKGYKTLQRVRIGAMQFMIINPLKNKNKEQKWILILE